MGITPPVDLTPRERDLVRGIVAGRTNREMAREFGISEQSVKNLLSIVYQKCHVRNRLELALYVVKYRLVSDESPGTHGTPVTKKNTDEDVGNFSN